MFKIIILPYFRKQVKAYAKKQRSLQEDLIATLESFDQRQAASLGNCLYKLRLASRGKGKSGSYRVIVLVLTNEGFLVPVALYKKSEREMLSKKETNHHLEEILFELRLQDSKK